MFAVISLTTGLLIILFSILGHFINTGKLIPYSMVGGSMGILIGVYLLYSQSLINEDNIIAVLVSTLIAFGITSLITIFNFDKPFLIFFCFLLIGLTTTLSNQYFEKHKDISTSLKSGILGAILILPTFYFIISSILKFRFKINWPFNLIEALLKRTNGQANFNAISPFIFGGGLALTFILNVLVQVQFTRSTTSLIKYKLTWKKLQPLNFTLLLMSCILGSVLFTYLLLENR